MRYGIWLYPWDVLDRGPEAVREELRELGIDQVFLALSYHSVRVLLPDNPRRRIFDAARGGLYFRPNPSLWSGVEIQPEVSDLVAAQGEAAVAARDALADLPMSLVGWTVCLHDSALVERHPSSALVDVWGGRSGRAFCLSQPTTRRYARALVRDAATRVDAVQLEAAHWLAPHAVHTKVDATQPHLFRRLSAFCFCDCCAVAVAAQGGDPERCRDQLARVAEKCVAEPAGHVALVPEREVDGYLAGAVSDYAVFARSRTQAVTSLVGELVRECGDRPVEFVSYGDRGVAGTDLAGIARAGASVRVLAYGPARVVETIVDELRAAPDAPERFALGLSALASDVADEATLRSAHEAALGSGATAIGFYNFGMLSAQRRRWLGRLTRS
jgi:hypothetical protein